jgi:hypothetical protein
LVKSISSNQLQKIDRPYVAPIYLVHLLLSGLTLYLSDRCLAYNGHEYEDYLFDLSNIGNEIRNLGGADNSQVTLRFKNDPIGSYGTLIEYFDDYPPEKRLLEIYKLYIDKGETFGSDVSTKIFKGEMGQPYEIYDPATDFKIDCSLMLFGKNASLPIDVIDLADFPSADPDDVGKPRNILYGSIKKVRCPWTVAGWLSTLTADITSSATSIVVSDSNNCPGTPFTSICDNEQIRVTANTKATGTLTVTRGYGGTTAVAHSKGANIYEMRSDFEVEVADHPVKAIGDIYAMRNNEVVRVLSGATKYGNSGGRAKIVFSDKVKFEEKTNQSVSTGSHSHSLAGSAIVNKTCYPTGCTGGFVDPAKAIDGNENSYANGTGYGVNVVATFSEQVLGTINKQYVILVCSGPSGQIMIGGNIVSSGITESQWGTYRFPHDGGGWNDSITVYAPAQAGYHCYLAEVYKEIEYTAGDSAASAATGVALSGNSLANMVIADFILCDVDGYQDDGSGTYTGTANALIERPDHVRKHILIALLGFTAGDIGDSFATVGAIYAARISGGYKFGFNLPDVAQDAMTLFEAMDQQSRSNFFEAGGKFQLAFGSTTDPTSEMTFEVANVKGRIQFSKTDVVDLRNKIRGHFFRDYSKSGSVGDMYQKVTEVSDSDSITKYGEISEDLEFDCLGDLPDMVTDVLDWHLLEKKELKKSVEFVALWDAMILIHCDYFIVNSTFWAGLKFKTLKLLERPQEQAIEVKGLEFRSS